MSQRQPGKPGPRKANRKPPNKTGRSLGPRVAAAKILAAVYQGQSLNTALPATLEQVEPADRPLIRELVYGSLREWPRLEGLARLRLRKPLKNKDADVLALIVMGLYQLSAMRIPQHAAVSETVEASRKLGKQWASSLVNGLLRGYQRDKASLEDQLSPAEKAAMSDWLWQTLNSQWPNDLETIATASRQHPPMTLRINSARTNREDYLAMLAAANIVATASEAVPSAITLATPADVSDIPGFADGLVSVQDESAQLAALLLDPQNGEQLLDACSAPGGKACHLLELAPEAHLVAADISEERLNKVRENAKRLQLSPELVVMDAAQATTVFEEERFDAILADVPCSATGVIRRNPDVKLLRNEDDPESFAKQQQAILEGLWPLLKPGGRLLYVTCSILWDENDQRIATALETLPGAQLQTLETSAGVATRFGRQCLPAADGGDGLYFSLLSKAR